MLTAILAHARTPVSVAELCSDESTLLTYLKPFAQDLPDLTTSLLTTVVHEFYNFLPGEPIGKTQFFRLLEETVAGKTHIHTDFYTLAGRLVTTNLYNSTPTTFLDVYETINRHNPRMLAPRFLNFVRKHADTIEARFCYENDFTYSYEAISALRQTILARYEEDAIVEKPQHAYMRAAIGILMSRI